MTESRQDKDLISKNFYAYEEVFPFLKVFQEKREELIAELQNILQKGWIDWPEKGLYLEKDKWDVYPFFAFGGWFEKSADQCPKTRKLIEAVPGMRTALYSRIGPGTTLVPHQGWGALSNEVLRCHFGLVVPEECGIWVEGEFQTQKTGEWLVFDDSKFHSGFNLSKGENRIILLIDVERPSWVAKGKSEVPFTPQLTNLVASLRQIL